MDSVVRYYNKTIKEYDRELYAHRDEDGLVSIMRKRSRYITYDVDGTDLHVLTYSPDFIFAITDTWTKIGKPIPLGSDRVLNRLKEIDAWAKKDYLEQLDNQNEKVDESKQRDLRNNMEAMFSDGRKQFAKATNDILTHSLDKTEKKRRIKDGIRERKQRQF